MAGELALVLTRHQQLIRTNYPKVSTFLSQYFGDSDVATIATAAADKLGLTLADGEQHSVVLEREEVVDHITTLPVDMPQAMEWFGRTAGGYTKFLGDVWDSALPKTTASVWCHVIYGPHAGGAWVHMAVCAVRKPAPIGITVMPIEFLTPEERKAIGVARPKRSGYLTRLSRCETPADSIALSRRPTTSSPCPRTAGCGCVGNATTDAVPTRRQLLVRRGSDREAEGRATRWYLRTRSVMRNGRRCGGVGIDRADTDGYPSTPEWVTAL